MKLSPISLHRTTCWYDVSSSILQKYSQSHASRKGISTWTTFSPIHTHQLASLQVQRLGQSRGGEVHQSNFGSIWDLRESGKLTKSLEDTAWFCTTAEVAIVWIGRRFQPVEMMKLSTTTWIGISVRTVYRWIEEVETSTTAEIVLAVCGRVEMRLETGVGHPLTSLKPNNLQITQAKRWRRHASAN